MLRLLVKEHFWYNEETAPYYPPHHALVGVPFSG